jgi:hypothetical protein
MRVNQSYIEKLSLEDYITLYFIIDNFQLQKSHKENIDFRKIWKDFKLMYQYIVAKKRGIPDRNKVGVSEGMLKYSLNKLIGDGILKVDGKYYFLKKKNIPNMKFPTEYFIGE